MTDLPEDDEARRQVGGVYDQDQPRRPDDSPRGFEYQTRASDPPPRDDVAGDEQGEPDDDVRAALAEPPEHD